MDRRDQLLLGSLWNKKKEPLCCPDCPEISTDEGNGLECRSNGLFAGGAPTANNGLSVSGSNIVFGQNAGDVGIPATLGSNREIPTSGFNIFYTGTGKQSLGYADTLTAPFTRLDVNGNFGVTAGLKYPTSGLNSGAPCVSYMVHGGSNWGFGIIRAGAVSSQYGAIHSFYRTYGTDASIKASVPVGEPVGRTVYHVVAADNTSVATAASFQCKIASTSGNVVRGYLSFCTADSSGFIGTSTEKLTISANGNVTVGAGTGILTLGESDFSKLRVDQNLTGSDAFSSVSVTGIWNTTGAPTAIKLNVTDTASDSASLLMDLQVGASSKFKVDKTGVATTSAGTVFAGNSGASAPSTSAAGTVTNRYGGATNFLGDPNSWTSVVIGGVTYKIPLYT